MMAATSLGVHESLRVYMCGLLQERSQNASEMSVYMCAFVCVCCCVAYRVEPLLDGVDVGVVHRAQELGHLHTQTQRNRANNC
jgi:hypothetical protein